MLVSSDASQIEWRVALQLSGDRVGLQEILNKEDTHTNNQKTFNLPTRHVAKIYLFRTIYRGCGFSFALDPQFSHVSTSPKYWDRVNEMFYDKYNGLDRWHQELCDITMRGDPIVSPFGREWLIPPRIDKYGNIQPNDTVYTNYPVQGTAADIMTIVRLSLKRRLDTLGMFYMFVGTIHDSIILEVKNENDARTINKICIEVFNDLPKNIKNIFGYDWVVPLACESKMGMDLHNMVEIT